MSDGVDSGRLDDPGAIEDADPGGMLRQVASSAAQIREARRLAAEAGIETLAEDGRPRAVVVTGMGGSGISGDVLAAVCGLGCSVPIVTVRGHRLPGWVGAADLVIAVSCSGPRRLWPSRRRRPGADAGCCPWAGRSRRWPSWPSSPAGCSCRSVRWGSPGRRCGG
jgi:hypothetical protein